MLTVYALLFLVLIGLFIWTARTARDQRPILPAKPAGNYESHIPGVVVRLGPLGRAMRAREAVRGDAGYVLRR